MNRQEFEIIFNRLSASISKQPENIEGTKAVFYDRFGKETKSHFEKAVDTVIDKEQYFPSVATMYKALREIYKDAMTGRKYNYCRTCKGMGCVSMILSFEHEERDGEEITTVKEKHYWGVGKQSRLMELARWKCSRTYGDCYYSYAFFCRCEKGEDLYVVRDRRGYQLTWEEFEELKSFMEFTGRT